MRVDVSNWLIENEDQGRYRIRVRGIPRELNKLHQKHYLRRFFCESNDFERPEEYQRIPIISTQSTFSCYNSQNNNKNNNMNKKDLQKDLEDN